MATNRGKWWRRPWLWIVVVPVVIVIPLTAAHQSNSSPTVTNTDSLCGAPPNPLGYNYCGRGSLITTPSPDTCTYFRCIGNWSNGTGHMEECRDGDVSMSGGRQGSCSHHRGNARAVYQG